MAIPWSVPGLVSVQFHAQWRWLLAQAAKRSHREPPMECPVQAT